MRAAIALAALVLATLPASTVRGAEIDWQAQLKGLDGVGIVCIREIERKYAKRLCEKLTGHASQRLKDAGIAHKVAPIIFSKDDFIMRPRHFDRQLDFVVHVRGTEPSPLGIDLRLELSHYFKAAVEQGSEENPRSGNLVFWTDGWTGAGPRKRLERAIGQAMQKDLDEALDAIIANFPK